MNRKSMINLFLIATGVALLFRAFVIEDYRIASNSMFPNLETGKMIFVSKSSFSLKLPFSSYEIIKFSSPKRSDIVAFSLPGKNQRTYVKRVVAIAGDRVELKNGDLYINGELSKYSDEAPASRLVASASGMVKSEQILGHEPHKVTVNKDKLPNYGPVDVPPNHFFALGDNRSDSIDSRSWGPVPYSNLKGRVVTSF